MKNMVLNAEWPCGSRKTTADERVSSMVMSNVMEVKPSAQVK